MGGGLYVANGTVTVSSTKITGNNVTGGNGGNGGARGNTGSSGTGGSGGLSQGGGLFVASGSVDLPKTTLTGNMAFQAPGGTSGTSSSGVPLSGVGPLGQGVNLFVAGGTVNTATAQVQHKDKIGVVSADPNGDDDFALDTNGDGMFDTGDSVFTFGLSTDNVITGDWTGDGTDKIGVVRPDGEGSMVFSLDTNGNGVFDPSDQVFHFGLQGDQIIIGDWNGAGKDEIGVVRPDGVGGLVFFLRHQRRRRV